jgi:3-phenylpropionate/trans-cinnamate dioxygenase ferredoxin reductase subunit
VASKNNRPIVIIGAGMAGGVAAKTLREAGYDGPLVLIGNEPGVPFGRPPLSKTYLRGEEDLSSWVVKPSDWYDENQIELKKATATSIDTDARTVLLDSGATVEYTKLLLTTGGRNRRIEIPGSELAGIFQLRTVADCDAIKQAAAPGRHALIVGMGFIGSEVAASLRQMGLDVTTVFPGSRPLDSVLGPEIGEVMAGIHSDAGVRLLSQEKVSRFEGAGHVERVVTESGRTVDCDLVVVAVGIQPNAEIVHGTQIALDNGILVDAACRTSVPDVFAAGDVANHLHPLFGRIRVEHYNNAEKQPVAAAVSMLGAASDYSYVHTFWSDQYEHKIEYVGHVRQWDQFVVRGSLEERRLIGFYVVDGIVRAAVGVDRGGDPEIDTDSEMAKARTLIARQAKPDPAALSDEDQDLL